MVVSSFTEQLKPFSGVESDWSSPGIGPKMQRVSCELAINFSLYAARKRENIDYFIAISDELVKKFGSLVPACEQASCYENNNHNSAIALLWRHIMR
jgi:hypothetical protein